MGSAPLYLCHIYMYLCTYLYVKLYGVRYNGMCTLVTSLNANNVRDL